MATKIPRAFIDELLSKTDIVNIIEPFVPLRKRGQNYIGLCPFHKEKTPSFTVAPDKQFYHCFGCGVSGNAISFLMEYERKSFVEAIETLAAHTGLTIPEEAVGRNYIRTQQAGKPLYTIMENLAQFYHNQLLQSPQGKRAAEYLQERGLNKEIIKKFNVGYAPPGWNNLITYIGTKHLQTLNIAGMLVQKDSNNYYDRFRDRIMFPIHDRRGRVVAFGGRALSDTDAAKYLNSPETVVFNKSSELYGLYQAQKTNLERIIVVEGYIDVLSLAQHGIDYAVAALGTATTSQHIRRLFRICPEIVFCFDGDKAGFTAAWRALETLLPLVCDNWQPKFIFLPNGEDPDSLIRKINKEGFENLIQKAKSLADFFFAQLKGQIDLKQIEGRARLVSSTMPYLQKMPNNITRELFLEKLAKMSDLSIEKLYKQGITNSEEDDFSPVLQNAQYSPIRTAISLLMQYPSLVQHIEDNVLEANIPGMDLFRALTALLKKHPNLSVGKILEHWRDKPEWKYISKMAAYKHMLPESNIKAEFCEILKKLGQQNNEELIKKLMEKAENGKITHDEKLDLQKLLKEKQKN